MSSILESLAAVERDARRIMETEGLDRKTAYARAVERAEEVRRRPVGEPSASMVVKSFDADGKEV